MVSQGSPHDILRCSRWTLFPTSEAQALIRVIDIETTGIDPTKDAIIEIASVDTGLCLRRLVANG
jgi:DNA polymerase III epsilon subunit-like protein